MVSAIDFTRLDYKNGEHFRNFPENMLAQISHHLPPRLMVEMTADNGERGDSVLSVRAKDMASLERVSAIMIPKQSHEFLSSLAANPLTEGVQLVVSDVVRVKGGGVTFDKATEGFELKGYVRRQEESAVDMTGATETKFQQPKVTKLRQAYDFMTNGAGAVAAISVGAGLTAGGLAVAASEKQDEINAERRAKDAPAESVAQSLSAVPATGKIREILEAGKKDAGGRLTGISDQITR